MEGKTLRRNVLAYYAFSFLGGIYLATGTTVLFERELGLSFSQIFTLDAIYMLMFILFEIPTGAFADLVGRKRTVIVGLSVLIIGALATGSVSTFFGLFLTFFIWAFGFSLLSGSAEAMLYDTLDDEKLFHRAIGRAASLSLIGIALAGVIGPLLYEQFFRLPYLFSSIPFAAALIAVFFFRERTVHKEPFSAKRHLRQIKEGTRQAFSNRFIIWSMSVSAVVFAVGYTFTSAYQPYLIEVGFEVKHFAFILPVLFLIDALGSAVSEKGTGIVGEKAAFWSGIVLLGASMLTLGFFANKLVVPVLFLYGFLQGILRPLLSTYANRHIESSYRATVVSVQSMFATITASCLLFLFGFVTDRVGVIALAGITGALVLIIGVPLLFLKPKPLAGRT